MAYSKTNWNNLAAPAINAENLNKIEQGIADAHEDIDGKSQEISDIKDDINGINDDVDTIQH